MEDAKVLVRVHSDAHDLQAGVDGQVSIPEGFENVDATLVIHEGVIQYAEESKGCLSKSLPSEEAKKFDFQGLCRSLEKLSQFEVEANSKVVESAVLQGINTEDIKKAGERLLFQEGCTSYFTQVLSKMDDYNFDIHILFVYWSGDILRTTFLTNGVNGAHIHSNELVFADSISTGNIDRHVESPMDKLKIFNDILGSAHHDSVDHISIYIGDSVDDPDIFDTLWVLCNKTSRFVVFSDGGENQFLTQVFSKDTDAMDWLLGTVLK